MSGDGGIDIQYAVLVNLAEDLSNSKKKAQNTMLELEADFKKLLGDSWVGASRDMYDEYKRSWDEKFARMDQIIGQAMTHVADTHDLYRETERVNVGMWQA
jgi:WXG100 family type VII secretion target